MKHYNIEIYYPRHPPETTLADRLRIVYPLFEALGKLDPFLLPKEWLVATGDKEGSFRYPAYEQTEPGTALQAYYKEHYRTKSADRPRTCTLWNGQMDQIHGASMSIGYNRPESALEQISIEIDNIEDWHHWEAAATLIKESATVLSAAVIMLRPTQYKPVFYDKPCVGWMLYLPRVLTSSEVPEAQRLEPVLDVEGKRLGTIVISLTDGILDVNNPNHINLAHDIEVRLADQDLLPRYPLLSTQ